jgi:hypothetical protein
MHQMAYLDLSIHEPEGFKLVMEDLFTICVWRNTSFLNYEGDLLLLHNFTVSFWLGSFCYRKL